MRFSRSLFVLQKKSEKFAEKVVKKIQKELLGLKFGTSPRRWDSWDTWDSWDSWDSWDRIFPSQAPTNHP